MLDRGSRYLAPIQHTIWAAHAESMERKAWAIWYQPEPKQGFHEQVYEHAMAADAQGQYPSRWSIRISMAAAVSGFMVEVKRKEFPYMFQWQNFQEGQYAIGIEPSSTIMCWANRSRASAAN